MSQQAAVTGTPEDAFKEQDSKVLYDLSVRFARALALPINSLQNTRARETVGPQTHKWHTDGSLPSPKLVKVRLYLEYGQDFVAVGGSASNK